MICKWCGNPMETRETVCRRCGKEAPAKSDCGGFYDLVLDAHGIVPPAPVHLPAQQKAAKKSGLPIFLGLLCCILVAVVVVTAASGNNAKKEVVRLEEELRAATEYEEIPLNQQVFKTVLRLDKDNEEESYSMKVDSDLPGSVVVKCTPNGKRGVTGYITELTVPNKNDGMATLQLDQDPKDAELTLQMTLGKAFGKLDADSVDWSLAYMAEDEKGNWKKEPLNKTSNEEVEKPENKKEETEPDEGTDNDLKDQTGGDSFPDFSGIQPNDQKNDPTMGLAGNDPETAPDSSEPQNDDQIVDDKVDESKATEDLIEITEEDVVILHLPYAYIKAMAKSNSQLTEDTEYVCTLVWKNKQGGSFTVVVEGITVP